MSDVNELADLIRKARMRPYDDGKGGTLYRDAKPTEIAEVLVAHGVRRVVVDDALADAWDEGRESGISDEQQAHRRSTPTLNPYRRDHA